MQDLFGPNESEWPSDYAEQFWHEYPRRIGKAAALKKLEIVRKSGKVPWQRLIEAVRRYNEYLAHKHGWRPHPKHPSTWLNQGCWDDELVDEYHDRHSFDERIGELIEQARELEHRAGIGRTPDDF